MKTTSDSHIQPTAQTADKTKPSFVQRHLGHLGLAMPGVLTLLAMKHKITHLILATLFTAGTAHAATFTWTGGGGLSGQRWSDAANWSEGALVSANTTDVIISGTVDLNMSMGSAYTIRSLTFDATNDAGTGLQLSQTGNSNGGVRHLTFSSDSGNATLTVDADSTGSKSITRNTVTDPAKLGSIILASSLDVVHNGSEDLTLGNGNQVTNYGAKITGAGGINKSGTGTLILGGANDYTGDTTVNAGTLEIRGDGLLGNGSYAGAITNNATFFYNGDDNQTLSGIISGSGELLKENTSTLTLSGTNTYTGGTRIEAGTVEIQNSAALGTGLVNLVDTGTQVLDFGADGLTLANNVQISNQAGTKTIRLDSGGAGHTGTLSGQLDIRRDTAGEFVVDVGNTDELLVTSAIVTNLGGGAGLTKEGDGLLRIEVNSSYAGNTVINGGTLRIRNVSGSNHWDAGTININNGSALEFTGGGQTIMSGAGDNITIDSNGGASISLTSNLIWRSAGVITTGGSQSTFSGAVFNGQNNSGNRVIYTVAEGTDDIDLLVSTSHNNNTGITKNGAGTLGLTSTSNATGNTIIINDGTLEISGSGRLNSGNYGSSITNAGIFRYNSSANQTLSGVMSGTGALTKDNSGILTLSGANTYSGNTSVSGGTLALSAADNNIASSASIDVASGAILDVSGITNGFALTSGQTLSGAGTVTGAMTITSGSVLSPGNSPGTLSTGNQIWNDGGSYLWEINASNDAGGTIGTDPGWDWLDITGSLDLSLLSAGGFTIDIDSLTSGNIAGDAVGFDTWTKGAPGDFDYSFTIATFDSLIGTFDASLFTLDSSGFTNGPSWDWQIKLSGNDLVLEAYAVPEPSSTALLGLGGLALMLRRKRS